MRQILRLPVAAGTAKAFALLAVAAALVGVLVPGRPVRAAIQVAIGLAAALAIATAVRARRSERAVGLARTSRAGALDVLLDAAIVAGGWGMFVWMALVMPAAHAASFTETLTSVAYPTFDFALLAILGQLLVSPQTRRLPSVRALVAAAVALLVSDCSHAISVAAGHHDSPWTEIGWLATCGLAAFGVLHISSRQIASVRLQPLGPSVRRLAVLGLSTLAAPVGLGIGVSRGPVDVIAGVLWGSVNVVLVFTRIALLFREQQRTQEELRETQRTLEAAHELAQIGAWSSDFGDREHIVLSPQCCTIFGIEPEDFDGTLQSFLALVHPEDRARVAEEDAVATTGRRRYELEYRIVRPDGQVRWIFDRGDFHRDASGRPVRLEGVVQDVTARRRADDAVRAAEARYRTLVERLPLVTYVNGVTPGEPPLYVSPQVVELLGHPVSSWLQDAGFYGSIVHEEDRERVLAEVQRYEWGGDSFESEYRMVAADGRIVRVLDHRVTIRDREGVPVGYQGFVVDLTARKDAEARYRTLVERLPLVTYVSPLGRDTTLSYISPQVEELIGYTAEECVAEPEILLRLIHPDDLELVVAEARRVRRDFDRFNCEYRLVGREGGATWVHDEMVVVRDDRGEPVCFQGFLHDITARKLLEEQLQQSQRLDVVGRLAGGIAHDFNNLMTAINGYTGFALERAGDTDPRLSSDLQEVQRAADRAVSLTQQLLAFSRRQVLQPRPVDLGDVVGDLHGLLARLLGEDVELVTYADPFAKPVLADPGRLEQVLVNLAANARDAMPAGGTLTIETRDLELDDASPVSVYGAPAGRYAAVVVRDTGLGMDEETLGRAFEPFFTTKEVGHGSGLGLSTVYGIVKQSGGWITIDSRLEGGTEVTIYLPATDDAPRRNEAPAVEPGGGSATVLLVEDEPVVRALVGEMLEREGHRVLEAPGPHEAIELFEENSCDVLVTDVVMPKMNGRELARHLRAQRPELAVVYTSGYTADRVLEQGRLEPGEHFLQKPFTADELAAVVREALAAVPAQLS